MMPDTQPAASAPSARERLAVAYAGMTAGEIAKHALRLADYIVELRAKALALEGELLRANEISFRARRGCVVLEAGARKAFEADGQRYARHVLRETIEDYAAEGVVLIPTPVELEPVGELPADLLNPRQA